jgi:hypothetical protein
MLLKDIIYSPDPGYNIFDAATASAQRRDFTYLPQIRSQGGKYHLGVNAKR